MDDYGVRKTPISAATEREIRILTEMYPRAPMKEMLEALPRFSRGYVYKKAERLGLRREVTASGKPKEPMRPIKKNQIQEVCCPECGAVVIGNMDFGFDWDNMTMWVGENGVELTQTEADILLVLSEQEGKFVRHDTLLIKVWGGNPVNMRTVWVYIHKLRAKLKSIDAPFSIENRKTIGYRLRRLPEDE